MKKTLISFLVFLMLGISASAQPLTVDEVVNYALANSFELRQGNLDIADAEARISEIISTGLPKLDGSVRYSYFPDVPNFLIPAQFADPEAPPGSFIALPAGTKQSLNASLDMSALLFDGSFFVGLRAARVFRELTEKELEEIRHEVKWNVKRAFYSALLVKEQIDQLGENIEAVGRLLDETRILYNEGFAELLDVRRLELNYSNLTNQRNRSMAVDTITINLLKFQMGWPVDVNLEITGDLESMAASMQVQLPDMDYTYSDRPDYNVLEVTKELNEMNIRQIRMGYVPNLYAFANHTRNLQRDDLFSSEEIGWLRTTSIGATLTVPIFDGLDKRARIQRAKISKEKVMAGQDQLRHAIDSEVRNSYLTYRNSVNALRDSEEQLTLSNEIYETVLTKYREGLSSSFELILSEQDLLSARLQYLSALYDVLDTRAQLEKALGK
ncbi:MAG: TolC family protein [Saprospirales bacterium]|nr:MAG: TolC family protein [Saprospirales bacterium]